MRYVCFLELANGGIYAGSPESKTNHKHCYPCNRSIVSPIYPVAQCQVHIMAFPTARNDTQPSAVVLRFIKT